MSRYFILLICVAVLTVHGRPRHHKHKHAHAEKLKTEDPSPQAYQQPAADQPLSDAPAGPQDLNVYNVQVHKMGNDNKVSGHMGPHSVSVNMQGPGMVTLDTNQHVVQPGEPKPDHSVIMVKETECKHECSSVNVHSGHQLPIPLPLTEEPTPIAAPKAAPKVAEAKPHDLKHVIDRQQNTKLEIKPHLKAVLLEQQHSPVEHAQEHAQEQKEDHEPEHEHEHEPEQGNHGTVVHVHSITAKEMANKILTKLESHIPMKCDKPKCNEKVPYGYHQTQVTNNGEPQEVFEQVDSNNVGMTVQGPGSVSVTSELPSVNQQIMFDPRPACPGENCAFGHSTHKSKGHH